MSAYGNAFAFEKISVSSAVKQLTEATFNVNSTTNSVKASAALITCDGTAGTNDVRYTLDGTTPSSSQGHLLAAGQGVVIYGFSNIKNFKCIRTSSDTTIEVTYFIS